MSQRASVKEEITQLFCINLKEPSMPLMLTHLVLTRQICFKRAATHISALKTQGTTSKHNNLPIYDYRNRLHRQASIWPGHKSAVISHVSDRSRDLRAEERYIDVKGHTGGFSNPLVVGDPQGPALSRWKKWLILVKRDLDPGSGWFLLPSTRTQKHSANDTGGQTQCWEETSCGSQIEETLILKSARL